MTLSRLIVSKHVGELKLEVALSKYSQFRLNLFNRGRLKSKFTYPQIIGNSAN